jgi:sec-independent protein translocase protein TatA
MDIGLPELLIVLFIVVLIFGPGRLVKLSRELGSGIREFREGLKGDDEVDKEVDKEKAPAPAAIVAAEATTVDNNEKEGQ